MGDPLPMVSSSMGAMNSLLDKLTALEAQHPHLADEGLQESLRSLSNILCSFAKRRMSDSLMNEWMLQVREVVKNLPTSSSKKEEEIHTPETSVHHQVHAVPAAPAPKLWPR